MKFRFSRVLCFILPLVSVVGCNLTVEEQHSLAQDSFIQSEQFSAIRRDFSIGQSKGFIILPTKKAKDGSKPWVWYAPTFIGHYPNNRCNWMFRQLLAKGFSICGVDVGESMGNPKGRGIYSEFYRVVVREYGLDSKACLLAQSRGGLMLYNWAAQNPKRVKYIAGIYTVCDIKSWPGLAKACGAYGMSENELRKCLHKHNPIDRLAKLAQEKVPILHIHGDEDAVVPLGENSGELVRRYKALGGQAKLIIIKGKGHEECPEFFHNQALLEFLLKENKNKIEEK